ncbi:hypothetical protein [Paenibacillus xerothermodurans]|uniref:hypothetical protein n=1 Tax=Paenibacillus xerothermodurans TaxID=1977292 RepID=UPI001401F9AF|nr:hypothetical protein [Paenibacillus xerothermodurans]
MLLTEEVREKQKVVNKLHEMELDQIANWVEAIPSDKWKEMFVLRWPTLVKKCGIKL